MKRNALRLLVFVLTAYIVIDADRYFSAETQQTIVLAAPYVFFVLGLFSILVGVRYYFRTRETGSSVLGSVLTGLGLIGWGLVFEYRNSSLESEFGSTVYPAVLIAGTLVASFWGGRLIYKARHKR